MRSVGEAANIHCFATRTRRSTWPSAR